MYSLSRVTLAMIINGGLIYISTENLVGFAMIPKITDITNFNILDTVFKGSPM